MSITSPTFSSVSDDSFHPLSRSISTTRSFSDLDASSDDEIVWTVSDVDLSASDISLLGSSKVASVLDSEDEDFVLLSRNTAVHLTAADSVTPNPQNRVFTPDDLSSESLSQEMQKLKLADDDSLLSSPRSAQSEPHSDDTSTSSNRKRRSGRRKRKASSPTPPSTSQSSSPHLKKNPNKKSLQSTGLGKRAIVDDVSEKASEAGAHHSEVGTYQSAAAFIDRFLSDPTTKDLSTRLTFFQSLIVELGLASTCTSLPASLNAAKSFLKGRVFLNIREYLRVRSQGQDALQKVMYPTRSALVRDIKRNRAYAPLKHVKQSGLQILLVPCFHHG
jgi:hypothetical protein